MGTKARIALSSAPAEIKDARRIMDNVVVLDITFHRPGIRRKADLALVETDAEKEMLGLTKGIVTSDEYQKVRRVANDTRHWLEVRSLPSPLKRGTYLVPVQLVGDVEDYLSKADSQYQEKADAFLEAYPRLVEEAKDRLRSQYNAKNYPATSQLKAAFSIERRFLDFGVPSEQKLGKALWEAEKQRAEASWSDAVLEIQEALRTAFRKLVGDLADRLEAKPDGSRKTFRDSTVEKVVQFIDLFKTRNLTNDIELEGLVTQARNVLDGKRPDALRNSAVKRNEVLAEMGRVTIALDKLLEKAPRRAISFKEED
jgi:hypothetical protein